VDWQPRVRLISSHECPIPQPKPRRRRNSWFFLPVDFCGDSLAADPNRFVIRQEIYFRLKGTSALPTAIFNTHTLKMQSAPVKVQIFKPDRINWMPS
jgi:hypothetical protein